MPSIAFLFALFLLTPKHGGALRVRKSSSAVALVKQGMRWNPKQEPPAGAPCSVIVGYEDPAKADFDRVVNEYENEAEVYAMRALGMVTLSFGSKHSPCVAAWSDFQDKPGVMFVEFDTPVPECRLVQGSDNLGSDPFWCGCLHSEEQVFCEGRMVTGSGHHFTLSIVLQQCPLPYCAIPTSRK